MEDFIYLSGATMSVATVMASSFYEYYKCKQIYKERPYAIFQDIKEKHNVLESIVFACGLMGYKIANDRNHVKLKKEQQQLLGNKEFFLTFSYDLKN